MEVRQNKLVLQTLVNRQAAAETEENGSVELLNLPLSDVQAVEQAERSLLDKATKKQLVRIILDRGFYANVSC